MSTKYVLLYESADDVLAKAPAHFPRTVSAPTSSTPAGRC